MTVSPRLAGTISLALAGVALCGAARAAEAPAIEALRAYLIYEDNGRMSDDVTGMADQIIAQDRKNGQSVQIRVDVILRGTPNEIYESAPVLHVEARSSLDDPTGSPSVYEEFPISFFATDTLVRSVIVNHECNGFDIEAWVMDGGIRVSNLKQSFSITCGD